jgi:hypothetical protein
MGQELGPILMRERGKDQDDSNLLYFLAQVYSRDYSLIQKNGAASAIAGIFELSQRKLTPGNESVQANPKVVEHMRAAAAGIRESDSIPNIWQFHIISFLKLTGFSQGEIVAGLRATINDNVSAIQEVVNAEMKYVFGKNALIVFPPKKEA